MQNEKVFFTTDKYNRTNRRTNNQTNKTRGPMRFIIHIGKI